MQAGKKIFQKKQVAGRIASMNHFRFCKVSCNTLSIAAVQPRRLVARGEISRPERFHRARTRICRDGKFESSGHPPSLKIPTDEGLPEQTFHSCRMNRKRTLKKPKICKRRLDYSNDCNRLNRAVGFSHEGNFFPRVRFTRFILLPLGSLGHAGTSFYLY